MVFSLARVLIGSLGLASLFGSETGNLRMACACAVTVRGSYLRLFNLQGFQSLWNFRCSHARGTIRVFRDDILPLW